MNRLELITSVMNKTQLEKKAVEKAVDSLIEATTETLAQGEEVRLPGFGSFKVSERAAKTGRNPRTGKEIAIAATKVATFRAGSTLKDQVNG